MGVERAETLTVRKIGRVASTLEAIVATIRDRRLLSTVIFLAVVAAWMFRFAPLSHSKYGVIVLDRWTGSFLYVEAGGTWAEILEAKPGN